MVAKSKTKIKSKFPKKSKKAWRITDIKDVEDFYENNLLEERLGGSLSEKPNEELFFIQKDPKQDVKDKHARLPRKLQKLRAQQDLESEFPRHLQGLKNISMVPDPISVRNRVKTHEERKSAIRKDIEKKLIERGIVKQKEIIAVNNRLRNKKNVKLLKPQPYKFNEDIWENEAKDDVDKNWLYKDTINHYVTNTGQMKVKVPNSIRKKPSTLPSIEPPHPGISYNPSPKDHRQLLETVAERELEMIKEEEHLQRVTTHMFRKIPPDVVLKNWLSEMSQGLIKNEEDTEDKDTSEYKTVNPPALLKRKPLKKKKKAKLLHKEELERQKKLVEKKKIGDLYKLRVIEREIVKIEETQAKAEENRKIRKEESLSKTKRLGRLKYDEPLVPFQRPHELCRNLRSLNPEGSVLADRFFSLQKRNIIEPRVRVTKKHRRKVKKYKRPGFKEADLEESYKNLKVE